MIGHFLQWRRCRARGATLIETIVVIFVLGMVFSLVLMGVFAAREAARKSHCVNNLRQIGIAIHSYAAAIKSYPQGINGNGFSVHAMILPYMDQNPAYNSINFSFSSSRFSRTSYENRTASSVVIDIFLCPSDIPGTRQSINNYAGNRGSGVQKFGYNGAFPLETSAPIGYEGFTDGSSTTAALTEWKTGSSSRGRNDPDRLVFETAHPLVRPEELDLFADACQTINPFESKISPMIRGEKWIVGELSYTMYTHVLGINENSCTNSGLVQQGAWTAGSYHGAGATVLFVDGHTRFVMQTIPLKIWRAIGSRDGGDVVPAEIP